MRKGAFIYLCFICLAVLSCEKYEHPTLNNPESCELCEHAMTLEGTFRGEVYIFEIIGGADYMDSATMTVEQVFLNNNTYDDSTIMYFATTYVRDSFPNNVIHDTVNIHDTYGQIENSQDDKYWMRNDSISRQRFFATWLGATLTFDGVFLRQ